MAASLHLWFESKSWGVALLRRLLHDFWIVLAAASRRSSVPESEEVMVNGRETLEV
jgi:hypothetical protein